MRLDLTHEQIVALFQDKPFDFEPGARFLYDNSGFYLLGMIVEQASGESCADNLDRHVTGPLGLRATRYCDERPLIPHRARAAAVARFAGTNALGPMQIRVFESAGKLRAQATGQNAFRLRWQGDSLFVAAFDDNVRLVFQPGFGPSAGSFALSQGGMVQTAKRVE